MASEPSAFKARATPWALAQWARRGAQAGALAALGFVVASTLWVASYRVIDPPATFHSFRETGAPLRRWRDFEALPRDLARAALAAEDARFCAHYGVDLEALRAALREAEAGGGLRGASTITQQTAKNAFLWVERSYIRKALEAWFTILIEVFWPKARIVEVYLNIVEFGDGVFGVEAAAQAYFNVSADALTLEQSARLVAVLPAPSVRDPRSERRGFRRRVARIIDGARTLKANGGADCING